jgi:hypothetical protein
MAPTAWYRTETSSAFDADEAYAELDVVPRDRIGSPLAGNRRKWIRRAAVVLVAGIGGGYAVYGDPSILPRSWAFANDVVLPAIGRLTSGPPEPEISAAAKIPPPTIPEPPPLVEAPPAAPPPSSASMTGTPAAPASAPVTTAAIPAPPAAPPAPQAAGPNRKRAEAAGLHPDLSPVLLASLSKADYDNAAVAIKTAVVETTDNGIFVWPKQRKLGLALFEVSFVPSTTADCRRYIVTIAKDGWLTTALPVEKCGVPRNEPKRPPAGAAKAASTKTQIPTK